MKNPNEERKPIMHNDVRYIDMKAAANLIAVRPRKLIDELENAGIFARDKYGQRIPKLEYIKQGYFTTSLQYIDKGTHRELRNKALTSAVGVQFLRQFVEEKAPNIKIGVRGNGKKTRDKKTV
jgi:phage antirepressor YoqD-like protein